MIKKLIASGIAAILAVSLAACNSNVGDGSGYSADLRGIIPKNTVELVIYTQLANFSGAQAGWAAEILKEKFNVKVTIINEMDGTFQTRMASGNLGDIVIFGNDGDEYLDAVEAGMLFDWEEDNLVQEFGPYIWEYMPIALNKNREISTIYDAEGNIRAGGKIYGFGHGVAANADSHEGFFYYPNMRFDLYERLGKPEINTLEDFIPVLEAMVALEPISDVGTKAYAVSSFPDWDGNMVMMVKSTGALYGYDEFHFGLYDTKTQTFEDCLKEGGMYLRALKFYNTLYQKGLFDEDAMTQQYPNMIEKYTVGAAHFNIFSWMASPFNTQEHLDQGRFMAPVPAKDQKNIAYGLNVFGKNRVWTIGAKTHYPELCMAIINWLCTPDGVLTYNYGPKGVTWDYDGDGNTYLTDLGLDTRRDGKTVITYKDFTGTYEDGEFQHNNVTWARETVNPDSARGETFDWEVWQSTLEKEDLTPVEQRWREWSGFSTANEFLEKSGHISVAIGSEYSQSKQDAELATRWNQVKECITTGSWSAIYAKTDAEFDAIVAKMISDAKGYGYDECIEWCRNEALLRKAAEDKAKK
jgi:multiple sugar transport system substrate-binding protein/putative aldouronate transport system substrate-binding protein